MAAQKRKSTLRRRKTVGRKQRAVRRHEVLTQPQPSSFEESAPAASSIPNNSSVFPSQSVGVQQPTPTTPNQPVDAQTLSQFPQQSSPSLQPQPQTQPQSPAQPSNILSASPSQAQAAPVQNEASFPQTQQVQDAKAQTTDTFTSSAGSQPATFAGMEEPEKKKGIWLILIIVLIFIMLVGGGLYILRGKITQNKDLKEKKEGVVSTPSQNIVVSPKPSPATESASLAIDVSKYTIKVLNGSEIRGEAAKVKDLLLNEKFNVEEIDNAETSDYVKTIIKAKKAVPKGFLDKLRNVLEKDYVLDDNGTLSDSENIDAIVIIGGKKQ